MRLPIRPLTAIIFASVVLAACGTIPGATVPVSVTLAGTGSGSVVSVVTGAPFEYTDIDTDDGVFESDFGVGWMISLVATADAGSSFAGFSGVDCDPSTSANTCLLTVDAAKDVTATFTALTSTETIEVTVDEGGTSAGSVVSNPAGIDTDAASTEATFDVGTPVTLTASVDAEYFAGWTGGPCDGLKTLTCDFTVATGQAPITANFNEATTLSVQVTSRSDTAEEFLTDSADQPVRWPEGYTYIRSDDLELAYDPTHGPQAIGVRFPNISIPATAVVLDATLGFTAFADPVTGASASVALTIAGEASTSSVTFADDPNESPGPNPVSSGVTSRVATTATVDWTITEDWTADVEYASPDVATVVREVLGLDGWASGGSLVFLIEPVDNGSTAFRRAYASDVAANATKAPTLTVQYVPLP